MKPLAKCNTEAKNGAWSIEQDLLYAVFHALAPGTDLLGQAGEYTPVHDLATPGS